MDKSEIEAISKKYEQEYGDILLQIAKILGKMAGQKDLIGIRWFFEYLKIIELKTLKLAGINFDDLSKKTSIN